MSRVGKKPIEIPESVEVEIDAKKVSVKGPKGSLGLAMHPEMKAEAKGRVVEVLPEKRSKNTPALWGLTRVLISNLVKGVTEGFEKKLELQGVGYRMAVQGKKLNMALGFSHPVEVDIPDGLEAKIEKNILTVSGIDKQKVGEFAASVRALRKVEPYKGKGFRYVDEVVRRKVGKKAVAAEK